MYVYKRYQNTHRHAMGGATGREELGVEILPLPLADKLTPPIDPNP